MTPQVAALSLVLPGQAAAVPRVQRALASRTVAVTVLGASLCT